MLMRERQLKGILIATDILNPSSKFSETQRLRGVPFSGRGFWVLIMTTA